MQKLHRVQVLDLQVAIDKEEDEIYSSLSDMYFVENPVLLAQDWVEEKIYLRWAMPGILYMVFAVRIPQVCRGFILLFFPGKLAKTMDVD